MVTYISNIFWFAIDKLLVLVGGLVTTIIVARYLGPENLGKITFGISISGLCIAIGQWGANHTIFDLSTKQPNIAKKVIRASHNTRLALYMSSWGFLCLFLYSFKSYQDDILIISISCLSSLYLALDIHQFYYTATFENKKNAISNLISKITSLLIRLLFVFIKLKPIFFVLPYIINNYIIYYLKNKEFNKTPKKSKYNYWFLVKGKIYVLTAIVTFVFLKINDILLSIYSTFSDIASYNMGIALAFSWSFIPLSIGNSLLPIPIKEKNELQKRNLFSFIILAMIVSSIPIIIIIYFLGDILVSALLGPSYANVSEILFILSLSTLFSSLGVVTSRIISSLGGGKYLTKKTLISGFIFLPLTFYLVSNFNLIGAAYSLLIIEIFSLTILNYFFNKNEIFHIHFSAFKIKTLYKQYKLR